MNTLEANSSVSTAKQKISLQIRLLEEGCDFNKECTYSRSDQ